MQAEDDSIFLGKVAFEEVGAPSTTRRGKVEVEEVWHTIDEKAWEC